MTSRYKFLKCKNCRTRFGKDKRWVPYCSRICAEASMTAEAILAAVVGVVDLGDSSPKPAKGD